MKIRQYSGLDRDAVLTLWNDVFPNSTGHNDPGFAIDRKLEMNDGLFFVAVDDADQLVGTVLVGYDGHRGWLYSLAVSPAVRRQGIGSQLVRFAESALTERGCAKVNLQVRAENDVVVAFYEALGYDTEPRISMGKRL